MLHVTNFQPADTINAKAHRKSEKQFLFSYLIIADVDGELKNVAELRVYGTGDCKNACFWLNSNDAKGIKHATGSARETDMYHNVWHVAAMKAICNAGFEFSETNFRIGDRQGIEEALDAIARFLPYEKCKVFKAHA